LNTPDLAEQLAKSNNIRLIFTTQIKSVTDHYEAGVNLRELQLLREPAHKPKIINMVDELKNGNFSPLSRMLEKELLDLAGKNKRQVC